MTLIDLSGLGLDTIEETEEEFRIGRIVTLRMLETHEGLNTYFQGVFKECTRAIVAFSFGTGRLSGAVCSEDLAFRYHDLSDGTIYVCMWELYQGVVVSPERV